MPQKDIEKKRDDTQLTQKITPGKTAEKAPEGGKKEGGGLNILGELMKGDMANWLVQSGTLWESVLKLFGINMPEMFKRVALLSKDKAELGKYVTALAKEVTKKLQTNKKEIELAKADESQGHFMYRAMGIQMPEFKLEKDAKLPENHVLRSLIVLLERSEIFYKGGRNAAMDGIRADKVTKNSDFRYHDPIFFQYGMGKKFEGGFIEEVDFVNNKIKILTSENGKLVKKDVDADNCFMVFHLNMNTDVIPGSLMTEAEEQKKKQEKKEAEEKTAAKKPDDKKTV